MSISTNGREPHGSVMAPPAAGATLTATSISRASQAALSQALDQALRLAEQSGLDSSAASLLRATPDEMIGFRAVLELALQNLTAGNAPAATALLQQVLGPAFALDQNQIALESAASTARNAQLSYQAAAPAGDPDPQTLTDVVKLRAWAEAAEQVTMAFDGLVSRLNERAELLLRRQ